MGVPAVLMSFHSSQKTECILVELLSGHRKLSSPGTTSTLLEALLGKDKWTLTHDVSAHLQTQADLLSALDPKTGCSDDSSGFFQTSQTCRVMKSTSGRENKTWMPIVTLLSALHWHHLPRRPKLPFIPSSRVRLVYSAQAAFDWNLHVVSPINGSREQSRVATFRPVTYRWGRHFHNRMRRGGMELQKGGLAAGRLVLC